MIYEIKYNIYVEIGFLNRYDISTNYIKNACNIHRKKRELGILTGDWQCIGHPEHGKKVLIKYDSIPKSYAVKYNLPNEVEIKTKQVVEYFNAHHNTQMALIANITVELKECIYKKYLDFYPTYHKQFAGHKTKSDKYAKNHAIFSCINDFYLEHGNDLLKTIFKLYSKLPLQSKITNYISFVRKVKTISELGIDNCIVNKLNGKGGNRQITNSFHIGIVEKLYSDPHKYKQPHIHRALKESCLKYNKTIPSLSWVKYHLGKTEVKNRLCEFRHGLKKYQDTVSTYTPRQKALYAGDLYMMDGTPLQFQCINEKGKIIRLNLYVVLDAYSGKIVGFDLSLSEDKHAVINSLHQAFNLHGHLPYEILHDNFSATKTDEFKILAEKLKVLGVTFRAAKVGNAQDKANVERFFNTFQSKYCSLMDGYLGEGITSKRKDARANPEFLEEKYKIGLPNIHEQKLNIIQLLNMYNVCENTDLTSCSKLYAQSEKPNVKQIDKADFSTLFWKEKIVKVSRSMVKLTILKTDYTFEIYDNEHKNLLNGLTVSCRYDESDLSIIHLFDLETKMFICECKGNYKLHQALANQTEKDKLELYKQSAKKKSQRLHNHTKTNDIQRAALEEIEGEELYIETPYSIYKKEANQSEYNELNQLIAMQSNIDFSMVKEYKEINTDIKYLNNNKKPINNSLNNKIYEDKPTLETYVPLNEKE